MCLVMVTLASAFVGLLPQMMVEYFLQLSTILPEAMLCEEE